MSELFPPISGRQWDSWSISYNVNRCCHGEGTQFATAVCVCALWWHFACIVRYRNTFLSLSTFSFWTYRTKLCMNQATAVPQCHQHHFPYRALYLKFSRDACPLLPKLNFWPSFWESCNESTIRSIQFTSILVIIYCNKTYFHESFKLLDDSCKFLARSC